MAIQATAFLQNGSLRKWALIVVLIPTIVAYLLFQLSRNPEFQLFGDLVYRIDTNEKVVALTFDDGPTERGTKPILELLQREGIEGTFFLNGKSIKANPHLARMLIDAGHEIGNHSYSHKRMVFMSYSKVAQEVESTTELIRSLGYRNEIRFRQPYGKSLLMLPYYLDKKDITTVTWDVESETFTKGEDTPQKIEQRTLNSVKPGSIILFHVMYGDGSTLDALPKIITKLKKRGYRFATVSELIALSEKSTDKR